VSRVYTAGKVTGESELLYTDSDAVTKESGYVYDYLGIYKTLPKQTAFIEKITYTGNGHTGINHAVKLSFNSIPSVVIIVNLSSSDNSAVILPYGKSVSGCETVWDVDAYGKHTLTIYDETTPLEAGTMLNTAGNRYSVIAIC
jgi:hypothetical protein